ncbi:MAG TPA: Maf family protein [Patescibacteria group bacterium]|nr:Maf family protein [Patescibacteria group bacterium]
MQQIILASGSKQRKMLMDALNIPYLVIPADIDEKAIRDNDFAKRAEKIARAKAEKVATEHQGIIIAGDSFAVGDNGIEFEKPKDLEDAKRMLRLESGNSGTLYAGLCYLDQLNNINYSTTISTTFTLRTLTEEEINDYVEKFPVLTWSGGISPAYTYGMTMVDKINGSLTGFTHGLAIEEVIKLLQKSGVNVHP